MNDPLKKRLAGKVQSSVLSMWDDLEFTNASVDVMAVKSDDLTTILQVRLGTGGPRFFKIKFSETY